MPKWHYGDTFENQQSQGWFLKRKSAWKHQSMSNPQIMWVQVLDSKSKNDWKTFKREQQDLQKIYFRKEIVQDLVNHSTGSPGPFEVGRQVMLLLTQRILVDPCHIAHRKHKNKRKKACQHRIENLQYMQRKEWQMVIWDTTMTTWTAQRKTDH